MTEKKVRKKETKPRRTHGEGALHKRSDGRWEGRLTIGYDEKGKKIYRSVYGRTKPDCVAKLNELRKIDFSTNTYTLFYGLCV